MSSGSSPRRAGVVSVVLVNFRGTDDTIEAVDRLEEVDWNRDLLEIIVVENASGDDSAARLRASLGDRITLVESDTNRGFTGGCNLGVAHTTGEFVAFLNNDAKPDTGWIKSAVERFAESPAIGMVASKVLDWEGRHVDYVGAALTWYGMGYKPHTGDVPPASADDAVDVLFGTGSAMFVRRDVFDALGGFDESYFMFFEDVDLGWRANLAGYRVAYAPRSVAFHRHHGSMGQFGSYREQFLLERNALYTLYKNLDEPTLLRTLPAAMGLAIRRGMTAADLDPSSFEITAKVPGVDDPMEVEVPPIGLAATYAIDQFVGSLPSLDEARRRTQALRKVPDSRLRHLMGETDAPIIHARSYIEGYENLMQSFDPVDGGAGTRVLVITGDPIGAKVAGPAIRAWNIASTLARTSSVRLVSLAGIDRDSDGFELFHVTPGDDRGMVPHEAWADVIVFQGHAMSVFDCIRRTSKILVVDIYDPMHLEQLEQGRELTPSEWTTQVADATEVLNEQLQRGDFFICASELQRTFYLGQLAALGRLNPATYDRDPHFRGLIDVVPFGLSPEPPAHTRPALRSQIEGIGRDDKVLLWSGGLYNWFDPQTLIRAVARLNERHGDVRLYFLGTRHPHPGVPEMRIVRESRALAESLGATGTSVFFNESWVDFDDRQNYLLEADAGVSTHHTHIETTFSFRTRIIDYLWAGLPIVVTEGDHFADLVVTERLGVVVRDSDVDALVDALEMVLYDAAFAANARENVARVRERYVWSTALAPLVDFVAAPHRARDAVGDGPSRRQPRRRRRYGVAHDLRRTVHYLRTAGLSVVVRKIVRRLRR